MASRIKNHNLKVSLMELPAHEPIPSTLEAQLIDAASVHQTPTLQPAFVEPQKCASPLPKLSCEGTPPQSWPNPRDYVMS